MAELFGKDRTVIGRHIRNIYKEEELEWDTTCAKFAHMGSDGDQEYEYTAYNLDVIISVGYRVTGCLARCDQIIEVHDTGGLSPCDKEASKIMLTNQIMNKYDNNVYTF